MMPLYELNGTPLIAKSKTDNLGIFLDIIYAAMFLTGKESYVALSYDVHKAVVIKLLLKQTFFSSFLLIYYLSWAY